MVLANIGGRHNTSPPEPQTVANNAPSELQGRLHALQRQQLTANVVLGTNGFKVLSFHIINKHNFR